MKINKMKKCRLLFGLLLILQCSFAQQNGIINNVKSPYAKLKSINIGDCRWTNGFWKEKTDECINVMIPNLGRLMDDPEIIHAYENFKVAAGLKEGEFKGWSFHDGDFYKYMEALSYAYALTKDERINQHLDEIISVVAKAQKKNGYLHTKNQIGHGTNAFHHASEKKFTASNWPFEKDGDHEFYNFGHMFTAACIHKRVTGKSNFLDIAIKAADLLYEKFLNPTPELAKVDWNPPHYMGLTELYRTTGDKRYLKLAEAFINIRGTGKDTDKDYKKFDESLKRIPIRQLTEGSGHAGFANYLYAGVADVYAEDGDESLLQAMERVWSSVVSKQMFVTGATGSHHFGLSENKEMVSESYGRSYDLPNISSYNETCANIGNAMWNWRMLMVTGNEQYTDVMEKVFYNSALSGISLDGKHYFYTNPLRFLQGHPHNTKDSGMRSPYLSVFCCPPNIIRTIASMSNYAYSTSDKGVWVNLYGSNVLNTKLADGSEIKLVQQSNYPWNGLVKITIDEATKKSFSMMLRIPRWVKQATLKVNGVMVAGQLNPGSYFDLNRAWKKGDVIELNLPMHPHLLEANPFVEETRNQVAVQRGPLMYCMEAVDLPRGVQFSEVKIPTNIELKPRFDKNLLAGVTVLEGEAERVKQKDWTNQLYRFISSDKPEKITIRLIPYYAWSNRGKTDMTVWLPAISK